MQTLSHERHRRALNAGKSILLAGLLCALTIPLHTIVAVAKDVPVKFSTSKLKSDKATVSQIQKLVKSTNRKLARAAGKNRTPLRITSVNIVDGCSASVDCDGDAVIHCAIPGPGHCEAGPFSVSCIAPSGNPQVLESSCPLPNPFD